MAIQQIHQTRQIHSYLTPQDNGIIKEIYSCVGRSFNSGADSPLVPISTSGVVKSLRITVRLTSISPTQLNPGIISNLLQGHYFQIPNLTTSTSTVRFTLYQRSAQSSWLPIGDLDLVRPQGLTSLTIDLGYLMSPNKQYQLQEGSALAVAINPLGGGFLAGEDEIYVWGSVEESSSIFVEPPEASPPPELDLQPVFDVIKAASLFVGKREIVGIVKQGVLFNVGFFTWHFPHGDTIGNENSGADHAINNLQAYFTFLWESDNAQVVGGKGATPLEDWTNNKVIIAPTENGGNNGRMYYTGLTLGGYLLE